VTDSEEGSGCGDLATKPPAAVGVRARRIRATAAAWMGCALGSGAAYVLQDRAAVAAGLAVAVMIVACAAVGLGAVLLGGGDQRSPFVRFMLLVCVLTGRPPGEYLPPAPGEH
jgi:hypothetical protein